MRRYAYVDTSSYLAVLLGEEEAPAIRKRLAPYALCSSTLLLAEAERNLVRMTRDGILSLRDFERTTTRLRQDQELFALRDMSPDLCITAVFPSVRIPRTTDLIHLRTAIWFAIQPAGLAHFETIDPTQSAAAREIGLPVPPPP